MPTYVYVVFGISVSLLALKFGIFIHTCVIRLKCKASVKEYPAFIGEAIIAIALTSYPMLSLPHISIVPWVSLFWIFCTLGAWLSSSLTGKLSGAAFLTICCTTLTLKGFLLPAFFCIIFIVLSVFIRYHVVKRDEMR